MTQYMTKQTHQAVRLGYHHTPSFSFTTRTNLATSLSLSFESPSRYKPFRNGVISSGRHFARVKNRSAKRVGGCKGS